MATRDNNRKLKFWSEMEFNRFGFMPLILTAQSCIGSVAVCFIMELQGALGIILLGVVAIFTIVSNALTIAQAPMKTVVNLFYTTTIVSAICLGIAIALR